MISTNISDSLTHSWIFPMRMPPFQPLQPGNVFRAQPHEEFHFKNFNAYTSRRGSVHMCGDTLSQFYPLAAEVDCSRLGLSGSRSRKDGFVFLVIGSSENHNRSVRKHRGINTIYFHGTWFVCLYRVPFVDNNNIIHHLIVGWKYQMLIQEMKFKKINRTDSLPACRVSTH